MVSCLFLYSTRFFPRSLPRSPIATVANSTSSVNPTTVPALLILFISVGVLLLRQVMFSILALLIACTSHVKGVSTDDLVYKCEIILRDACL